ncbi:MAG: aminotransferase class V-fold PLP-dependent enzyme, partial [Oscillospiraceae bacterium]
MDCEELAGVLGKRGIAVRAGLHCAPLAHNMAGTAATGTVRVSVSAFNHAQEIDRFLVHLGQILNKKP